VFFRQMAHEFYNLVTGSYVRGVGNEPVARTRLIP
jgi:hypothetical protein